MRCCLTTILLCVDVAIAAAQASPAHSDTVWSVAEREARKAVVNAVLNFRPDLRGDSVILATCRLASEVQDSAVASWIAAPFRHLLVAPFHEIPGGHGLECSMMAFQKTGSRVLWLEDLIEVQRRSSSPLASGVSYEVTFQWLRGNDYRRFERYVVRPRGSELRDWRVVQYELVGEEWMDSFGGASRPP
jgi:hypothetical protein